MKIARTAVDDYVDGFEAGYAAGQFDGFRQGEAVEAESWCIAFGGLVTAAMGPRHAELEQLRGTDPATTNCPCPPCVLRRDAVRRNGGDFPGTGRSVAGRAAFTLTAAGAA